MLLLAKFNCACDIWTFKVNEVWVFVFVFHFQEVLEKNVLHVSAAFVFLFS
jgi:hypothetical protein